MLSGCSSANKTDGTVPARAAHGMFRKRGDTDETVDELPEGITVFGESF